MPQTALVLHNDSSLRSRAAEALGLRGYRVLSATSGKEATDLLETEQVDLLIIDGERPAKESSGWLRRRRATGDDQPVVYVTGLSSSGTSLKTLVGELGVDFVLYKPLLSSVLGAHLDAMAATMRGEQLRGPQVVRSSDTLAGQNLESDLDLLEDALMRDELPDLELGLDDLLTGEVAMMEDDGFDDEVTLLQEGATLAEALSAAEDERARSKAHLTTARILVVDDDEDHLAVVEHLGRRHMLDIVTAKGSFGAINRAADQPPDAAILTMEPGNPDATIELAARLRSLPGCQRLPLALAGERDDLPDLGLMVYIGATHLLPKPVRPEVFAAVAHGLWSQVKVRRTRVIITDNDPVLCRDLSLALRRCDMEVVTISDPVGLVQMIEKTNPDIVLVDAALSGVSGYDVCRRLHKHPGLEDLPVIVMTAFPTIDARVAALEVGATDTIHKPILPEQLAARIQTITRIRRLERMRQEVDSPTELLRRPAFAERCRREIETCAEHKVPFNLVWVHIDTFEELDDVHDPVATERVILAVGRTLQTRLRVADLRCRWREGDVVVVLKGLPPGEARKVVVRLLDDLEGLQLRNLSGEPLPLAMRAGMSSLGVHGTSFESLMQAAKADALR